MAQAVSDLSASNAPSRMLWAQLASLYGVCGMVSIMMVYVFIQGKLNKTLRVGIYLFAGMNWVSSIGIKCFYGHSVVGLLMALGNILFL